MWKYKLEGREEDGNRGWGQGRRWRVLLMCRTGSDKGLVAANQLLSYSSSQRPVCFLGLLSTKVCVYVCFSELGGSRMVREIVGRLSLEMLFSELDSASLTVQLRYDWRDRGSGDRKKFFGLSKDGES